MTPTHEYVDDCEFCGIARGIDQSPEIICEGPGWLAFFPQEPATPGHTLVIPRAHVEDVWKLPPVLGAELMAAVIKVGRAVDAALHPEGMNLITSAGAAAEQTVFHLHLHVVPRWRRDGFGRIWPVEGKYEDERLDHLADRIRQACA